MDRSRLTEYQKKRLTQLEQSTGKAVTWASAHEQLWGFVGGVNIVIHENDGLTDEEYDQAAAHYLTETRRRDSQTIKYRIEMQDTMRKTGEKVWVPLVYHDDWTVALEDLDKRTQAWKHVRIWRIVRVTEEVVLEHKEADNRAWEQADRAATTGSLAADPSRREEEGLPG